MRGSTPRSSAVHVGDMWGEWNPCFHVEEAFKQQRSFRTEPMSDSAVRESFSFNYPRSATLLSVLEVG